MGLLFWLSDLWIVWFFWLPDLSDCLICLIVWFVWYSDLSDILILLIPWFFWLSGLSDCLICLMIVWFADSLICRFSDLWILCLSDLSDCLILLLVCLSACLIPLLVWFLWLSDPSDCLIVWFSSLQILLFCRFFWLSDCLIVWFFWFFWFQQIGNQKNSSAAILAVYYSDLQTSSASSNQLSYVQHISIYQTYRKSGIVFGQMYQVCSIRISALTEIQRTCSTCCQQFRCIRTTDVLTSQQVLQISTVS